MNIYLGNLVKNRAYPHYILSFFAPRDKRDAVLGVFALNAELEAVPHLATEPTMRLIRYQWWRDALNDLYNNAKSGQSPIADILHKKSVPLPLLINLIDAHAIGEQDKNAALHDLCVGILGNDRHRFFKKAAKLEDLRKAGKEYHPLMPFRLWLGV